MTMSDDFFSASRRQGQTLGIPNLGDPDVIRQVFTRAPKEYRIAMLDNVERQLTGRTFARSETRQVARLNRLRNELNARHRSLLRLGR
jgi:hypothetical protein